MTEKKCAEIVNQKYLDTVNDYQLVDNYFDLNDEDKSKHEKHEDLQSYDSLFDYVNQSALGFDFVQLIPLKIKIVVIGVCKCLGVVQVMSLEYM